MKSERGLGGELRQKCLRDFDGLPSLNQLSPCRREFRLRAGGIRSRAQLRVDTTLMSFLEEVSARSTPGLRSPIFSVC